MTGGGAASGGVTGGGAASGGVTGGGAASGGVTCGGAVLSRDGELHGVAHHAAVGNPLVARLLERLHVHVQPARPEGRWPDPRDASTQVSTFCGIRWAGWFQCFRDQNLRSLIWSVDECCPPAARGAVVPVRVRLALAVGAVLQALNEIIPVLAKLNHGASCILDVPMKRNV